MSGYGWWRDGDNAGQAATEAYLVDQEARSDRRLVNCVVMARETTPFGTTYLRSASGADGIPERAVAYAQRLAGDEHAAARAFHGYEIAGVEIVDVITGERWFVQVVAS